MTAFSQLHFPTWTDRTVAFLVLADTVARPPPSCVGCSLTFDLAPNQRSVSLPAMNGAGVVKGKPVVMSWTDSSIGAVKSDVNAETDLDARLIASSRRHIASRKPCSV